MNKKIKIAILSLLIVSVMAAATVFFSSIDVPVLNPKGEIADKQRDLIIFTLILSAVVVVPVFTLLGVFAWKYREGNKNHKNYRPDWDDNKTLEVIWWGIPCAIIAVLGFVAWKTSHDLDPYKALDSKVKPVNVQVVALQWKWLFIYPEQKVASVNRLEFPEKTPVNFTITADAPMNSFWIPSLGGQVYAMSGMSTKLHLMADAVGTYRGSSANISGKGFADMAFTAHSSTKHDFDAWVWQTRTSGKQLTKAAYDKLAEPGTEDKPLFYSLKDAKLYDKILMKYMAPGHDVKHKVLPPDPVLDEHSNMKNMPGMEGM